MEMNAAVRKYNRRFPVGSLVEVTENMAFAPAGVYQTAQVFDQLLWLQTGEYWFAVGDIYFNYLRPVSEDCAAQLTDEETCIAYANAAIQNLS